MALPTEKDSGRDLSDLKNRGILGKHNVKLFVLTAAAEGDIRGKMVLMLATMCHAIDAKRDIPTKCHRDILSRQISPRA